MGTINSVMFFLIEYPERNIIKTHLLKFPYSKTCIVYRELRFLHLKKIQSLDKINLE